MATAKPDRYASKKEEVDEFESLTERLAADLRTSIRALDNSPILSDSWFQMAETFGRIASITDMESKLAGPKNDGTLWETEEQALRFLLEDGKLNLCLRTLIEFKQNQIEARKKNNGPMIEYSNECDKFEKGLGSVMHNAWLHVEVLQTTDIPALLNHIAVVLESSLDMSDRVIQFLEKGDLHQRQELMVINYLNSILKHVEDIREHRVMPIMRERKLFMSVVRLLVLVTSADCKPGLSKIHKLKVAETLSLLVDTDDFGTYRTQYYDNNDVETLLNLKKSCIDELFSEFENRKSLRPLVDSIEKAKRQMKLK